MTGFGGKHRQPTLEDRRIQPFLLLMFEASLRARSTFGLRSSNWAATWCHTARCGAQQREPSPMSRNLELAGGQVSWCSA